MKLIELARKIEKFSIDNSPTILTTIGVVGVVGTAVLTHKAALKADELRSTSGVIPDRKALVKVVWKEYIPAAIAGSLTVTCIVGANRIGSKRAAALAAAYTISERGFQEYREKVVGRLGTNKEQAVRDEIAQDRINANPVSNQVIIAGNGSVLCYDQFSGRYFNSTMENLKKAQNDTNYRVLNYGSASLSDFYERVGLPATDASEEVGWTTDKMLELEFSTCLTEDDRPCISFGFFVAPARNYFRHL